MKVTFLTPTLELHGGTLILASYANRLAKAGHSVTIITPDRGNGLELDSSIVVKSYPALPIRYVDTLLFQTPYFRKIEERIEECDFIIPIYTPLLRAAIRTKRRKNLQAKIVLIGQEAFEMPIIGPYNRKLLSKPSVQSQLSRTIAVSTPMQHSLTEILGPDKVTPILNGIDLEAFKDFGLTREPYLLFVGRPNIPKGYPLFKSVCTQLASEFPELKAKLIAPGIEADYDSLIEHIPFKNKDQLVELYSRAAIYVCASTGESFGLPALEAMACATPVITTATTGSAQYAIDQENCLVVPVGDVDQMKEAIRRLLTDTKLAKKLSENGPKTAKKYDGKLAAETFLSLLQGLLA